MEYLSINYRTVYDELNRYGWSDVDLRTYEQAEKYKKTYIACLDQKFDEGKEKGIEIGKGIGREEGIEIGKEKGREEGIEIGKEKGREEGIEIGKEKRREEGMENIALKLLARGDSIEEVKAITGMTKEKITAL